MTAPDAPTAMTLEEAMQIAKANAWDVMFESGGFVGIARTDGKGGIAFAEGWDVAFSAALGYPVVKRDDTAELVEALNQWNEACDEVDRMERDRVNGQRNTTDAEYELAELRQDDMTEKLRAALAKWKERQS